MTLARRTTKAASCRFEHVANQPLARCSDLLQLSLSNRSLRVEAWESPPIHAREDDPKSWRVLQRVLKHNLSAYEPDPVTALRAAGQR